MYLCDTGTSEGYYDSHHINSELKLQELGDAVVHISPPHHGLHYTGKVIIRQDDVRGLLGHICTSDALHQQTKQFALMHLLGSQFIESFHASITPSALLSLWKLFIAAKYTIDKSFHGNTSWNVQRFLKLTQWCRFLWWKPCSGLYIIYMIISSYILFNIKCMNLTVGNQL